MRKVYPAADFVWVSKDPVETLGQVTSISFDDPSSLPLKDHPLTSEEVMSYSSFIFHLCPAVVIRLIWILMLCQIKYLCEDLRVLGKQDFKQLLK